MEKFKEAVNQSKEDFVQHHREKYAGELPIWVAVEVMDWGQLCRLFGMAPQAAQREVADACQLSVAQFGSWIRTLNVLRNLAAHHARIFNRSFDITPKLNGNPCFDGIREVKNRAFCQLTLIQYLHRRLGL